MSSLVWLIGLDFGSTTSSLVIARASLVRNCVTGRSEFGLPEILFRSEPAFTPFTGDRIDETALQNLLSSWTEGPEISPTLARSERDLVAGGAIVTGLAASRENAEVIARLVRERFSDSLVATADDPDLESWVAFMGNCCALSLNQPESVFLNLDIGGGTTNLALGRDGQVVATGCLWVGARHFQFEPGSYKLKQISPYGERLLRRLRVPHRKGTILSPPVVDRIVALYVRLLEKAVSGKSEAFLSQVPFLPPRDLARQAVVTFSGGVGELLYRGDTDRITPFGDLGTDLARGIRASPCLSRDIAATQPPGGGRATVFGLALHHTELSGTTLFLPEASRLPLPDLPIVAAVESRSKPEQFRRAVMRAKRGNRAAAIRIDCGEDLPAIRRCATHLKLALERERWPAAKPLVLLCSKNMGKTMGNLITDWGRKKRYLLVIDEVPDRPAQFASLGAARGGVVPIFFYGTIGR
jgi:ethanolamine utilization protein EutA